MSVLPVRDALFESVAERTGLPRPYAIAAWAAVEEYARGRKGGLSLCGLTADWLAAAIGCGLPDAKSLLAAFVKAGAVVRDPDGGGSRIVRVAKTSKNPGAAIRMARMRARRKAEAEKAKGEQTLSVTTAESYVTARNVTLPVTPVTPVTQGRTPAESTLERNVTPVTPRSLIGDSESGNLSSNTESLPKKPARKRASGGSTVFDREFEEMFWPAYRRKTDKELSKAKFAAARRVASLDEIMAGLRAFDAWKDALGQGACTYPHPSTWLFRKRWTDELPAPDTAGVAARCGTAAGPPKSRANPYYDLDAMPEPTPPPRATNGSAVR